MKKKLYFETLESEICYSEDYFTSALEKGETIEVYEAYKYKKEDRVKGIFWCYAHQFCGDDTKDTCGKICKEYKPRNGKSGVCKHHTTALYYHGDKVTLKA